TITATDSVNTTITGTSGGITITPAAATHFVVLAPSSATAGNGFIVTVAALDAFNNTATSYNGTVKFTSTDSQAGLPANSTLTGGLGFFAATLKTAGNFTITATDTVSSITGTSGNITVSPGAATRFTVVTPATAVTGVGFSFSVTAWDDFSNVAT